jgi:hypothetical protein
MRGKVERTGTKAENRRRGDAIIIRLIIATLLQHGGSNTRLERNA